MAAIGRVQTIHRATDRRGIKLDFYCTQGAWFDPMMVEKANLEAMEISSLGQGKV